MEDQNGSSSDSSSSDSGGASRDRSADPVVQRRQIIARWTARANRLGYLLYGVAIAVFVVGFMTDWNEGFTIAITVCLVIGSILLAPAIVIGYAIKAAEREDLDVERRRRGTAPR